jgi:hypothetical protein
MMNCGSDRERSAHEAIYANVFRVGHRPSEMFLEFGQIPVEGAVARWHTCIVTSPLYAKDLLNTLVETLREYEEKFGPVPEHGEIEEKDG